MDEAGLFADLLRRIARKLANVEREQICCGNITLQQFHTLRALRDGGLTTSAVAERQDIDLSTASRNLTVLEKHGYLSRVRGNTDSRQVENRLTDKGQDCVESLCCDEQAVYAAILDRVPPALRARLLEALHILSEALESADTTSCC